MNINLPDDLTPAMRLRLPDDECWNINTMPEWCEETWDKWHFETLTNEDIDSFHDAQSVAKRLPMSNFGQATAPLEINCGPYRNGVWYDAEYGLYTELDWTSFTSCKIAYAKFQLRCTADFMYLPTEDCDTFEAEYDDDMDKHIKTPFSMFIVKYWIHLICLGFLPLTCRICCNNSKDEEADKDDKDDKDGKDD